MSERYEDKMHRPSPAGPGISQQLELVAQQGVGGGVERNGPQPPALPLVLVPLQVLRRKACARRRLHRAGLDLAQEGEEHAPLRLGGAVGEKVHLGARCQVFGLCK